MAGVILGLPRDIRTSLPSSLASTLRARAFDLSFRRDQVLSSIRPVLDVLGHERVPFLVFKGPALARLHERPAARMYGDIDLLVKPSDFARARTALESVKLKMDPENQQPWDAFDTVCREGVNLADGPAQVDLHHRIPPWCFSERLTFEDLYQASMDMDLAGTTVRIPCDEHAAVIAALAVINDLYKGVPALMTWRDLSNLLGIVGTQATLTAFDRCGLLWLADVVIRTLDPAGTYATHAAVVPPRRAVRLRLELLGWHRAHGFAIHPLGWIARLPPWRALVFLLGSVVPSHAYAKGKHGGYLLYWRKCVSSVSDPAPGL